jgi:hypothetical protein
MDDLPLTGTKGLDVGGLSSRVDHTLALLGSQAFEFLSF